MLIQFTIEMFVLLIGIYYFTIFLHLMGIPLFKAKVVEVKETLKTPVDVKTKKRKTVKVDVVEETKTVDVNEKFELSIGKALIPFYYWFTRETTV